VSSIVSLDDVFVVGVGCDLVGGWFLARGLLVNPVEVRERAASLTGGSPPVMAGMIRSKAEGEFGLAALTLGFLLQAGGYLAVMGGVQPTTGGLRWPLAIVLAGIVVGGLLLIAEQVVPRRIQHHARAVAPVDAARSGEEVTEERSLAFLGMSLGYGEVDMNDGDAVAAYVREHFGGVEE
jgi:hypothetical protein